MRFSSAFPAAPRWPRGHRRERRSPSQVSDDISLHAGFDHGRQVGQQARALLAGDRERLQAAGPDLAEHCGRVEQAHLHLAVDHGHDAGGRGAIGHVLCSFTPVRSSSSTPDM